MSRRRRVDPDVVRAAKEHENDPEARHGRLRAAVGAGLHPQRVNVTETARGQWLREPAARRSLPPEDRRGFAQLAHRLKVKRAP